jgi:hypothetical protein
LGHPCLGCKEDSRRRINGAIALFYTLYLSRSLRQGMPLPYRP